MNNCIKRIRTALFAMLLTIVGMTNIFAQSFTVDKLKYSIIEDKRVSVIGPADGAKPKGNIESPYLRELSNDKCCGNFQQKTNIIYK